MEILAKIRSKLEHEYPEKEVHVPNVINHGELQIQQAKYCEQGKQQ